MAKSFLKNGNYFETITEMSEWPDDGRVPVPKRPSADYGWDGGQWIEVPPDPEEQAAEQARQAKIQADTVQIETVLGISLSDLKSALRGI